MFTQTTGCSSRYDSLGFESEVACDCKYMLGIAYKQEQRLEEAEKIVRRGISRVPTPFWIRL